MTNLIGLVYAKIEIELLNLSESVQPVMKIR